jgi:formylglycine-generating enzyme required for sulfatase activity
MKLLNNIFITITILQIFINAELKELITEDTAINQVKIEAGSFFMGCSAEDLLCDSDEGPKGGVKVFVKEFKIDIHETSVSEYKACVDAGECIRPFDYKGSHYCNFGTPGRANYPVNCVNWELASNYCQWRGKSLHMKPNGKRRPELVQTRHTFGVISLQVAKML